MSISVHKTGLSKTLGQKSDEIYVESDPFGSPNVTHKLALEYDLNPSISVLTLGWSATTVGDSSGGLKRYNGITHNNSTPHNFQFDGTDDYLGKAGSSGYGGDSIAVWAEQVWAMCQWFKYNNVNHYAFYLTPYHETDPDIEHLSLEILTSNDKAKLVIKSDEYSVDDSTTFDFTFTSGKWYYIALTSDGAGNYKFYVNGSFVGDSAIGRSYARWTGNLNIGRKGGNAGWVYTGAGTKVGHVHLYGDDEWPNNAALASDLEIKGSALRQNFLATHEMHSDRIYGGTFEA